MTYTDRHIEAVTVTKVEDGGVVTWDNGWTFGGTPSEHHHRLVVGAEFIVETRQFSLVTGMATMFRDKRGNPVVDEWLWHKSDADLAREHAEMVARHNRERETNLAEHRDDWTRREAALPSPLRRRLERYRANGGHTFDRDGWGYELVVCELAVLYAASAQEDTDAVMDYARINGTSGNQHDYAKALSRLLTDDVADQDAAANSVSALSPITGDPDYSATR